MRVDLSERLWSSGEPTDAPAGSDRLLEQYKLYVEMADRVSQRRAAANTFFLTLNTAVIALVGSLVSSGSLRMGPVLLVPLIALVVQCGAWFYLVRSYRQLNAAKFRVIGTLEERLPASPWWRAEWTALGKGVDRSKYWPLSHLEQALPALFALLYAVASVAAMVV